jgi:hypothetical protein
MITKREFSAIDAAPVVLYGKTNEDSVQVSSILINAFKGLLVSGGMAIPNHDQQVIDESDPANVSITYKLLGVTVATKTIVIDGTTTTITII